MRTFKNCSIQTKPSSHAMTFSGIDEHDGVFTIRLKVNLQSLNKFTDVMPLLIPAARTSFQRVSFSLDLPVELSYMSKFDTVDLSGKKVDFKVEGDKITCFVRGYDAGIAIPVSDFVATVNDMFLTITGAYLNPIGFGMGSHVDTGKSFRLKGIVVPGILANHVIAAYNADVCILARYSSTEGRSFKRFEHYPSIKYFTYSDAEGWVMVNALPFLSSSFKNDTDRFNRC